MKSAIADTAQTTALTSQTTMKSWPPVDHLLTHDFLAEVTWISHRYPRMNLTAVGAPRLWGIVEIQVQGGESGVRAAGASWRRGAGCAGRGGRMFRSHGRVELCRRQKRVDVTSKVRHSGICAGLQSSEIE